MERKGKERDFINSNLNLNVWEAELKNDEDNSFLLQGLREGFCITNINKEIKAVHMSNYKSALENKLAVEKQINIELEEGRYIKVDSPPPIVSALGAIPKDDQSVRLIHDCSKPEGYGVNDYAVQDYEIRYQTVQDACELLDEGGFMAKIDLKSAYRSVPLHPSQYQFTGLQWVFRGDKGPTYMIDTRLPFGSRLSPQIFHRMSQAVRRMLIKRNIKTVIYLDDIYITASSFRQCKDDLNTAISLLRTLGWAIAWHKVVGPTQKLTFLGIEIDSLSMTMRLPVEKVIAYRILFNEFLERSRASKRQIQRIAGIMAFSSHVVNGGKIYQQRVLDSLRSVRRPQHRIRLGIEFKKDLQGWLMLLEVTNSKSIRKEENKQIVKVYTDASQSGAGIISDQDWAYISWDNDLPQMKGKHINVKETTAIIIAAYRWAAEWTDKSVVVYTDNITARAAINKGRCRDVETMEHIRRLFWLSQLYRFSIKCVHIKGSSNVDADSVSRLNEKGHLLFWLSLLSKGLQYSIVHVYHWFLPHMSVLSCAHLLSQVRIKIPWLRSWTKQWQCIGVGHLQTVPNNPTGHI